VTKLRAGTSGYSYKEWKGSFYPEDLAAADMLAYYAGRFGAVEINNTFYRLPKSEVLAKWASQVPEDFRFVLKASQHITHRRRLNEASREPLEYLLKTSAALGAKRGPLLFQLPPNMQRNLDRLRDFLSMLPAEIDAAFEFRHPSWYEDEVFDLLRANDRPLCIADSGDSERDAPFVSTADWGYLRLRRQDYEPADLEAWSQRIRHAGWREAWVFFKHEDEGAGPRLAQRLLEAWPRP